jgi:transposase-like protein
VPVRHDREFWERACGEVLRGAKVGDVAPRLGVRPRTLQWWSWKLRRESTARSPEFLPIVISEHAPAISTAAMELETSGVRIRVELGTDVQYVAKLVAAIRAAC